LKKNPLWWGKYVLGREPAAEYNGNLNYESNDDVYDDMHRTTTTWSCFDWMGPYAPSIWNFEGWNTVPRVLWTFMDYPPYFIDVANKALVPNHRRWPLGEPWLHRAITKILSYTELNAQSSGYCYPPSSVFIPKNDSAARTYWNKTIEDYWNSQNYGPNFEPDVTAAINILKENCYYIRDGNIVDYDTNKPYGDWYTKDGPSMSWVEPYLEDNPVLRVGTVEHRAQEWYALGSFAEADQLPGVPGVNVKLGPWVVIDVYGWSDINDMTKLIAQWVREYLDIPLTEAFPEYGTYEAAMNNMNFDFSHFCMWAGVGSTIFDRYGQVYTGSPGCYSHEGDARNPEMEALLLQYDAPPPGKTRQDIANEMQNIFGRDLPVIPTTGHPDWYVYYTVYWVRQPNVVHGLLPCSPYGGGGYTACIQKILLSLGSSIRYGLEDIDNSHKVDGKDITAACAAFLTTPGKPRWDFACDINSDGKVDGKDISKICLAYLKTWTFP
jgi:hypothetical protein